MRVLITTSRMPTAIDEIRKLGSRGHFVVATDTFASAPGNHSKYAAKAFATPSPHFESEKFVADIALLAQQERIELVIPTFEDVLHLAKSGARIPSRLRFYPTFDVLKTLHGKASFITYAKKLKLRVPETVVVTSRDDLEAAIRSIGTYFAKPVYSRGGIELLTNAGKLAGAHSLEEVAPSPARPWIVQQFVEGQDLCTFSVAQRGRVTAHTTYVHPREIEHSGGIVFESIDDPQCLLAAERIVADLGYHGQISFDFIKTKDGLVLIECNPRPCAGVHMMTAETFEAALLDVRGRELRVTPAGVRRKYSFALLRDMVLHVREAAEDARHLFSDAKEVIADPDDLVPAVYQVVSYTRVMAYRKVLDRKQNKETDLKAAYFEDVCWNDDESDARGAASRKMEIMA